MLPRRPQLVHVATAPIRALVFLGLALVAFSSQGQSLTATVDRNTVPVGETLTLTLTFDGVNATAAPTLPPLANFTILPSVSQRNEISFINGQQSVKFVYEYQLQATKAGDVVIPPFQASVGGRLLSAQPIQVKVVPASAAAAAQTNLAFVKLVAGRSEVYLGEPFPVEIHLYWQSAKDVRIPQLRADGFSIGQGPKPNPTRTQIGNVIYNLAVFKMTATAVRTGLITLGPAETSLTLLLPINTGQQRRDPFGFFNGPQYQERPANIASEAIQMRVLSLPKENVPETFNGAIGNFQVTVTAAPTNVGVGDPITMRIRIAGRGPLEALTLPAQPDWRDFNSYPPTAKIEAADELGLSGAKNFEQVIVPQNHELKAIPPFRFTYFDSQAKSYITRTAPAIPLTVNAGAAASAPLPSLTNAAENAGNAQRADDIIHIRPRMEMAGVAAPVLLQQPWFLWLQGAPVALWLAMLIRRKRNESLANNPRLRRQREVAQRIREGLRELRAHAEGQKSDEFFATLFRLLQEQLGERLDLPASAITESVVDERLRSKGVRDETLRSLHELFQTCNLARYAPLQSSQELSALIPKLESALKELQEIKA